MEINCNNFFIYWFFTIMNDMQKMKFKNNGKVITLVDKGEIKKRTIGFVACDFINPNEVYDVEFWNETDSFPYGNETYLPEELEIYK